MSLQPACGMTSTSLVLVATLVRCHSVAVLAASEARKSTSLHGSRPQGIMRKEVLSQHDSMFRHSSADAKAIEWVQRRSAPITWTGNDDEPIRDPVHLTSIGVLCQGPDVRVLDNGQGIRSLQFRVNGTWSMEEGKMKCDEAADDCRHEGLASDFVNVGSATGCHACPCTSSLPIQNYWSPYQDPMMNEITAHCQHRLAGYNFVVVGIGTGGTAQAVARSCPLGKVSVIEKQQSVFDIADHYFGFDAMKAMKGFEALVPYDGTDGLHKLLEDHGSHTFDAIIVDCMIQGKIPDGCKSDEFYGAIAQNLKPGGIVFQWAWPSDHTTVKGNLERSLGSSVRVAHWWASGSEADKATSLIMLSGIAAH